MAKYKIKVVGISARWPSTDVAAPVSGIFNLNEKNYEIGFSNGVPQLKNMQSHEIYTPVGGIITIDKKEYKVIDFVGNTFSLLELKSTIGGIYNKNGIDLGELVKLREMVEDPNIGPDKVNFYEENIKRHLGEYKYDMDLFKEEADVLIPAALAEQFVLDNKSGLAKEKQKKAVLLKDLKVKAIVEGANNSVVAGGEIVLQQMN
jgi:hypothetical protein